MVLPAALPVFPQVAAGERLQNDVLPPKTRALLNAAPGAKVMLNRFVGTSEGAELFAIYGAPFVTFPNGTPQDAVQALFGYPPGVYVDYVGALGAEELEADDFEYVQDFSSGDGKKTVFVYRQVGVDSRVVLPVLWNGSQHTISYVGVKGLKAPATIAALPADLVGESAAKQKVVDAYGPLLLRHIICEHSEGVCRIEEYECKARRTIVELVWEGRPASARGAGGRG
jgi:hypothetical protein